ncbi:MAG TPA: hypothetical protein VMV21_21480 [Vicinamibacteria bacterium]|nr:hypothetical protein [Vicinamibacteria bacterium]
MAREAATFVFFLALAFVATRPLGRDLFGQMPAGPDPLIDLWTVDWISGHLLSPDLFGGNIFHPFPGSVLYSDLSLGTAVLVAPLRPLLRDPVPVYNVSLLLAVGLWPLASAFDRSRSFRLVAQVADGDRIYEIVRATVEDQGGRP